jgi:Ca2+-binding EF-hand superfamily protein
MWPKMLPCMQKKTSRKMAKLYARQRRFTWLVVGARARWLRVTTDVCARPRACPVGVATNMISALQDAATAGATASTVGGHSPSGASAWKQPGGGGGGVSLLKSAVSRVKAVGEAVRVAHALKTEAKRRRFIRYRDYDFDGAIPLDIEEFYSLQPRSVREKHGTVAIRRWHRACCAANGAEAVEQQRISINQFFLWTLSPAAAEHGAIALGDALIKYDTTPSYEVSDGNLDMQEFAVACRDMGFDRPSQPADIFKSLDKDLSGEVSYTELVASIEAEGCGDISLEAKMMMLALAWTVDLGGAAAATQQAPQRSWPTTAVDSPSSAGEGVGSTSGAPQSAPASATVAALPNARVVEDVDPPALHLQACSWRIGGRDKDGEKALAEAQEEAAEAAALFDRMQSAKQIDVDGLAAAKRGVAAANKRVGDADYDLTLANAAMVREEVEACLSASGGMVADLVRLILSPDMKAEREDDVVVDDMQFHEAMTRRLGYRGTPWTLRTVFRSMDLDGDGEVCFDELWEWVRGVQHPLDRRIDRTTKRTRDVAVEVPPGAKFCLDDISWDERTMRSMIWRALERAKVSTLDLLRVSCLKPPAEGIHALCKADFVRMVSRLLRNVSRATWEAELEALTEEVFTVVSGKHDTLGGTLAKRVDVRELERWLGATDDDPDDPSASPPLKRVLMRQSTISLRETRRAAARADRAKAKAKAEAARAAQKIESAIANAATRGAELRAQGGRPGSPRGWGGSPWGVATLRPLRVSTSTPKLTAISTDGGGGGSCGGGLRPSTVSVASSSPTTTRGQLSALSSATSRPATSAHGTESYRSPPSRGLGVGDEGLVSSNAGGFFMMGGGANQTSSYGRLSMSSPRGERTAHSWRSASALHLARPPRQIVIRNGLAKRVSTPASELCLAQMRLRSGRVGDEKELEQVMGSLRQLLSGQG